MSRRRTDLTGFVASTSNSITFTPVSTSAGSTPVAPDIDFVQVK